MNRGVPTSADNSSGPSVGASSLVTDANSGLSGGPHLQRSASINADSYMRLPASPLSFSSNNISGSSAVEAGSVLQDSSRAGHFQGQVASCATSLLAPQDARLLLPPHKRPKVERNVDDLIQQQAIQRLLQGQQQGLQQFQGGSSSQVHNIPFQQQQLQQRYHPQMLQSLPAMQNAQIGQSEQIRQQQLYQQALQQASSMKRPIEGGILARRLMQYLYHQRQHPHDNNIFYWRKFVAEYFSPRAKKKWCLSSYENIGNQIFGVFPRAAVDVRHCGICGSKSGKAFETTFEVLPRLYKIKFESGVTDEILYLDMPLEYRLASGIMVLDHAKAVMESVYEHLRVVREGQLRVTFATDLKILSWEFCTRRHEELLPRRLVAPPVNQLIQAAQKYQNAVTESGSSGVPPQDLRANCNMFVSAGCQLARNLELQSLNDLGFSKRYVRCLQIAEVVDIMKDLISFSREHDIGAIESLKVYPGRAAVKVETQMLPENCGMNPQNLPNNQVAALTKLLGSQPNPNPQINRNLISGISQGTIQLNNYQALLRHNYINPNMNTIPRAIHSGTGLVSNNISFQGPAVPSNAESFSQPIQNSFLPQKRSLGQMAGISPQNVPNVINQFPHLVNQRMVQDTAKNKQGTSLQSINGSSTSGSAGGVAFGSGIENVEQSQSKWIGASTAGNNTVSAKTESMANPTSVSLRPNDATSCGNKQFKLTPDSSADVGSSSSYLFQETPGSPNLEQLYEEISQGFLNGGMFESRQREIGDWKS